MDMTPSSPAVRRFAQMLAVAVMALSLGATRASASPDADVLVASGTLDDHYLDRDLFHIGEFWMQVPSKTQFHRWLLDGMNRRVDILITTDPKRFSDEKNVRILDGTLMHQTAPKPTASSVDVKGALPDGNLAVVHVLFLKDETTGTFGPITFETSDFATASKFDAYDDRHIAIIIKIE